MKQINQDSKFQHADLYLAWAKLIAPEKKKKMTLGEYITGFLALCGAAFWVIIAWICLFLQ